MQDILYAFHNGSLHAWDERICLGANQTLNQVFPQTPHYRHWLCFSLLLCRNCENTGLKHWFYPEAVEGKAE